MADLLHLSEAPLAVSQTSTDARREPTTALCRILRSSAAVIVEFVEATVESGVSAISGVTHSSLVGVMRKALSMEVMDSVLSLVVEGFALDLVLLVRMESLLEVDSVALHSAVLLVVFLPERVVDHRRGFSDSDALSSRVVKEGLLLLLDELVVVLREGVQVGVVGACPVHDVLLVA